MKAVQAVWANPTPDPVMDPPVVTDSAVKGRYTLPRFDRPLWPVVSFTSVATWGAKSPEPALPTYLVPVAGNCCVAVVPSSGVIDIVLMPYPVAWLAHMSA